MKIKKRNEGNKETWINNKFGSQNACHNAPYRFWKQATKRHKQISYLEEAQVFLMLISEKISSVDPL